MSRRNVNRDALQRQAERINRAPAGQVGAVHSATRANRAAAGRADGGAAGRMSPAGRPRPYARQPRLDDPGHTPGNPGWTTPAIRPATPAGRPRPYARQPRLDGVLLLDALKAACVHRLWALAHEWHTPSTVAPNCGASYGQRSGSCQPRTVTALGERETVV